MSPAGFLLLALGISIVGSLVLWARTHRPGGIDASIDGFRRELAALSPERSPDAVVREQSRLRAEGRWIDRPQPSGPVTGGDAPSVVIHGRDDVADQPWPDAVPHDEVWQDDEAVAAADVVDAALQGRVAEAEPPDDGDGGYFDDLYRDVDEER